MDTPVIAMIGAGNMGSSLIGGLIKDGHPADKIWATDTSSEKLHQLNEMFHIHTSLDNQEAAKAADVLIFAIKPQIFAAVAKDLAPVIQTKKPLILSIAAGTQVSSIERWCGGNTAVVRAMPNTPALISCGATGLFANTKVTPAQHELAESILRAVGIVIWVDQESTLDIVTALSGSGPAYFFLMMEALQTAAEELGLSSDSARLLTLQTAFGAARMALESDSPLDMLRKNVTSPGGTTEKAVQTLEEHKIRDMFKHALHAAKARSEELAKLLGDQ